MKHIASLLLGLLALQCLAAGAQTPAPTQRIRGDVVTLEGHELQVKSRSGETLTVKLADNYVVTSVVKIDIAAVKPGTFIGTAAMPQPDGTLTSLEVLLFPESMRGSGEGYYAWDLAPGSMMTNATVASVTDDPRGERRMTLTYKGGENTIVVPKGTPVVTFEPGDPSMVIPGAHVLLTAAKQPDGSLTAARVVVGKGGLVPPM